ncbi:MAG: CBS domain-containing protein [Chloroflexota bacterium]|nr:CBS domain-containing protein [Chloroflexota bacterium]
MNASDIMSTELVTVSPNTQVTDVVRLLLDTGVPGLPVVDENGHLLGMVTEADVVTKHARPHVPTYLGILGYILPIETSGEDEEVRRVLAVTAAELMSKDVPAVAPDTDVDDVATLMVDEGINPVPVVDRGRVIGVVGHRDIIRLLVREEEDDGSTASAP